MRFLEGPRQQQERIKALSNDSKHDVRGNAVKGNRSKGKQLN